MKYIKNTTLQSNNPIRIIHIDDDGIFLKYIKVLLEENEFMQLVAQHQSGEEFIEKTSMKLLEADCVLMDYSMPGIHGIPLFEKIREYYPSIPVISFTSFTAPGYVQLLHKAGIAACLDKSEATALKATIIECVAHGTKYIQQKKGLLTDDDAKLLRFICKNYTREQIASALFIGVDAVKKRKKKLVKSIGIENNHSSFLKWALKHGHFEL